MTLIKTNLLSLILILYFSLSAWAEGFDYYEHINKYAKCEAIQNVAANILSESEEEFYRHEYHHASLDSRIVALEFARAGNYQEEVVDELYDAYLSEYKQILSENDNVDNFMQALRPHIAKCKELNEMQEDIIQRKKEER